MIEVHAVEQEGRRNYECTGFCAFSFYKVKHLERQSWNRKILITHNHSQHCRVCFSSFVRQPFSKQLYIEDDDDDDDDHEAYDKGDDDDNTH